MDDVLPIPVETIWVNYALVGWDEGYPAGEAVGTLIHAADLRCYVKISPTHCRRATAAEVRTWTGPVSPRWYRNPP